MPSPYCTVCTSDKRHQVEIGLVHGTPLRTLAKRFSLSPYAIHRHGHRHLSPASRAAILSAQKPEAVDLEQLRRSESEGLLSHLVVQRARLAMASQAASEFGNFNDTVKIETAIVANLKLTASLLGQLVQHHQVEHRNVLISPGYLELRAALLKALKPHPAAARDVSVALHALETAAAESIKRDADNGRPLLIEGEVLQ